MAQSLVWQPCAGATLLMPTGNAGDHLHIVLNDPRPFENYGHHPCVLLVNLSSVREAVPYDTTCVLVPGEHPFLTRESFVFYRYARIEQVNHVLQLMRQGVYKPHELMLDEVFQRIKAGLFSSPHTKREFKRFKF